MTSNGSGIGDLDVAASQEVGIGNTTPIVDHRKSNLRGLAASVENPILQVHTESTESMFKNEVISPSIGAGPGKSNYQSRKDLIGGSIHPSSTELV